MVTADQTLARALGGDHWSRANRELVAKILTELMFEDVIAPDTDDAGYRLPVPEAGGPATLRFTAVSRLLGHQRVDAASLRLTDADGAPLDLPDAAELVAVLGPALGIEAGTLANAVVELSATVLADAHQLARGRPVDELVDADPLLVEGEMRGHPWIVANKGRLGFDLDDLHRYSPEAQHPFGLQWLAVRGDRADTRAVPGLDHTTVVAEQLGPEGWADLRARATAAGADPDTCAFVPVHPWQWSGRLATLHAGDIARGAIVPLGEAAPRYLPQASIRTLVDIDHPERRSIKLALSILNTSVYRGIPRERALVAPALSAWLCGLAAQDPFLRETGVILLGEVASVSVAHTGFAAIPGVPYQHTELLGAIWRESVVPRLEPGERAVTLAALLHRDPSGRALVEPLVERSGLRPAAWVQRLHDVTLPPLLHTLYRYGTAFSPHAQNCLVVLRDDVPTRLVVKDFVDDLMVSCEPLPELADLPDPVRAVMEDGIEGPLLVQWLQGGLLVCVHRYLSELFEDVFGLPETAFWAAAARTVRTYQARFADELSDRFALFEVDAPAFVKLCLNRVRIYERGYADHAERPEASASGWIDNPLAWAVPTADEPLAVPT
jgi:siderophore synthetase component